ncbi:MAG: ROK family transcriptional regulator [Anaerolineaceae bacterium]|nr:ROK family transcriptional regulator [Anaerolineaceae bacterium]
MYPPSISRFKTIAQTEMRAINRSAVLEYLRLSKTASRTELSTELMISKPTVMRIVDDLLAAGVIISLDEREKGARRSRELLALNAPNNLVLGVDIGGSHISAIIATIGGEILYQNRTAVNWSSSESNYQTLIQYIKYLRKEALSFPVNILGIAIGVPGIIDSTNGVVRIAPSLNWHNFPLLEKLESALDIPVIVENDVNLAVLGENWFGIGEGVNNLVMISVGTGIGSGIILDGKLHRGFRDSSGEIGYLLPGVQYLDNQYPGFGALESLASCSGITDRAIKSLKSTATHFDISKVDTQYVFDQAREGQTWAKNIVNETVDFLSLAIANISVCFDPELIIIGGGIAGSIDMLIAPIQKRLMNVIPFVPKLEGSRLLNNAPLLGAVVRVFQKCEDYTVVHVV